MGNLTIKSQSLATQADYVDATSGLTINVSYNQDNTTGDLKSINGTIYKTDGMTYAGNFSGQPQGDEMEYSISGVKSRDMAKVFAAIEDIEELIEGENNNAEE
jgi:hypothetical protein